MDDIDHMLAHEGEINERRIAATRALLTGKGTPDCVDCGDPIPTERREALPNATRCIGCQEANERRR
jgi:phage/conjugal plasmid C-4 type zinc finger TraR family protein